MNRVRLASGGWGFLVQDLPKNSGTDAFGNEISVGDTVVFAPSSAWRIEKAKILEIRERTTTSDRNSKERYTSIEFKVLKEGNSKPGWTCPGRICKYTEG